MYIAAVFYLFIFSIEFGTSLTHGLGKWIILLSHLFRIPLST